MRIYKHTSRLQVPNLSNYCPKLFFLHQLGSNSLSLRQSCGEPRERYNYMIVSYCSSHLLHVYSRYRFRRFWLFWACLPDVSRSFNDAGLINSSWWLRCSTWEKCISTCTCAGFVLLGRQFTLFAVIVEKCWAIFSQKKKGKKEIRDTQSL